MLTGLCPDSAPTGPRVGCRVVRRLGRGAPARRTRRALESACPPRRRGRSAAHRPGRLGPARRQLPVARGAGRRARRARRPAASPPPWSTAMNYGLAEALSGRSDAGDLLQEAEERGLFVTGFDSGGWFEVHSLVREVLLAELARRSPDRLREQHARAARWLESMGDRMAAIEHWLDAGEPRGGAPPAGDHLDEPPRRRRRPRRDRPDPRTDPARGLRRERRLAGAVRLVPPADRPGRASSTPWPRPRERLTDGSSPRGEGSPGHPALGVRRGSPATGEPASTAPPAPSSCSATQRAGRPHRAVRLEPGRSTVSPSTSAGATTTGSSTAGRTAVVNDMPSAGSRTRARARWASRWAATPSSRCASPPASGGLAESADMRTLRTELDFAEAVAARELGDRDGAESALSSWPAGRRTPARTSRCSPRSSWSRCGSATATSRPPDPCSSEAGELVGRDLDGPGGRARLARTGVLVALAEEDLDRRRAVVGSGRRPLLGADLRGQGPSRRRPAARRRRGRPPRGAALRAAPGRARPGAGARHLDVDRTRAAQVRGEPPSSAQPSTACSRRSPPTALPVLDLVELAAWRAPGAWMDRLRTRARARSRPVPRPARASSRS